MQGVPHANSAFATKNTPIMGIYISARQYILKPGTPVSHVVSRTLLHLLVNVSFLTLYAQCQNHKP